MKMVLIAFAPPVVVVPNKNLLVELESEFK